MAADGASGGAKVPLKPHELGSVVLQVPRRDDNILNDANSFLSSIFSEQVKAVKKAKTPGVDATNMGLLAAAGLSMRIFNGIPPRPGERSAFFYVEFTAP